ncbi:MAG: archaeosortase/exosortase family protein [Candidatus ainarchaeum sp.]|nr:archaeosortase/exosortase family protein [Candidatus ainarchaeum sp.]
MNMEFSGKRELFFIIKFFIIFFALQFLILALPLAPVRDFIAGTEGNALGMAVDGNRIFFGERGFEVTNSCTGLVSGAILAAVIFPLKKPGLKKKLAMAISGALVLFLLNFPRIWLVLAIARNYGAGLAELLHEITWITTALLVLLVWYFAAKKIAKIKNFAELL